MSYLLYSLKLSLLFVFCLFNLYELLALNKLLSSKILLLIIFVIEEDFVKYFLLLLILVSEVYSSPMLILLIKYCSLNFINRFFGSY